MPRGVRFGSSNRERPRGEFQVGQDRVIFRRAADRRKPRITAKLGNVVESRRDGFVKHRGRAMSEACLATSLRQHEAVRLYLDRDAARLVI